MKADLHLHTNRYSGCSNIDPVEALRRAEAVGLAMIALTEHGIRWPDAELAALVEQSRVKNLVVIPGEEAACYSKAGRFQGEFLVFGYPESLGSSRSAEQLIDLVHGAGGVVIAAHPFKPAERGNGFYGCGDLLDRLDVDGLEIEHPGYGDHERRLALEAMRRKGVAGLGCGDAHDLRDIGACWTGLNEGVIDAETLFRAIRSRETRAFNGRRGDIVP